MFSPYKQSFCNALYRESQVVIAYAKDDASGEDKLRIANWFEQVFNLLLEKKILSREESIVIGNDRPVEQDRNN